MAALKLFDRATQLLEATVDRRVTSQRIMSRNIANIDTPNYKGTGLEFQKQLRAALDGGIMPTTLAATHPGHITPQTGKPFDQAQPEYKDIGPVNLDIEMTKLAENNIMFNAMIQLLGKKFNTIKAAIAEKGGG